MNGSIGASIFRRNRQIKNKLAKTIGIRENLEEVAGCRSAAVRRLRGAPGRSAGPLRRGDPAGLANRWLEEQGHITGYRAELDRRRIGLGVLAFVRVDAERNNAEATRALEDTIRGLPEVVSCHYISGAGTFELQVVATDLDAYSRWTMDTLFKLPNVKDVHTRFSLGEVKAGAALPLRHLSA